MNEFLPILEKARPSPHLADWTLPTALVAEGFGCTSEAIRSHKTRNCSELREGKHWVKVTDPDNIARIYWSKRGIVRLGFLIDSDRARAFRDAAEDFILFPQAAPDQVPLPALDPRCKMQRRSPIATGIGIFTGVAEVLVIAIAFSYAVILAPFWVGSGANE